MGEPFGLTAIDIATPYTSLVRSTRSNTDVHVYLVEQDTSGVLMRAWCPAAVMNDELRLLAPDALTPESLHALATTLERMEAQILANPGVDPHGTFPHSPPIPSTPSCSDLSLRAAVLRGWLEGRVVSETHGLEDVDADSAFAIAEDITTTSERPRPVPDRAARNEEEAQVPTLEFASQDMVLDRVHLAAALREEWVVLTHLREELRHQQAHVLASPYAHAIYDASRRRIADIVTRDPIWAREVDAASARLDTDSGLAGLQVAAATLLGWVEIALNSVDQPPA